MPRLRILTAILTALALPASATERLEGTPRMKERAYSPAVITEGGRIVWLAGIARRRRA
jgi:hypothetical protein